MLLTELTCAYMHMHMFSWPTKHHSAVDHGPAPRSWHGAGAAARPGRTRRAADARAHTKARGSGGDLVLSRKGWSLVSKRQERRDVKGAAERPCGMAMGKLVCWSKLKSTLNSIKYPSFTF